MRQRIELMRKSARAAEAGDRVELLELDDADLLTQAYAICLVSTSHTAAAQFVQRVGV